MRLLGLLVLALLLQACVPAVPASEFVPTAEVLAYPPNKTFLSKIQAVEVIVRDDAEAHGAVTLENVASALRDALTKAGYLNVGAMSGYILKATVSEIDYPALAFDLNVKATISYEISRMKDRSVVLSENVTIGHEVGLFEVPDGTERLRKAIAKAISGNITHFLRLLAVNRVKG